MDDEHVECEKLANANVLKQIVQTQSMANFTGQNPRK